MPYLLQGAVLTIAHPFHNHNEWQGKDALQPDAVSKTLSYILPAPDQLKASAFSHTVLPLILPLPHG